ncbi:hypothetical protein TSUD_364130 [Trifolium subterraneum]|uniref:Copine C-terminal domain-containing protein n=1 Tax=Trifolium subterraneum TaxID=3900 RepID=A0A2Z6NZ74_TRISU|nr:hypothetical protein TSUD_364130 [Trifolium subterraneum]
MSTSYSTFQPTKCLFVFTLGAHGTYIDRKVTSALRNEGLESSNLILGIDFTKSNEWTGRNSFNNRSLHAIGDTPNPYEKAISIIGKTLAPFDDDNLIPCFGFGDATTHDHEVFNFHADNSSCHGFEEVLACYQKVVPNLSLSGPTSYAPVIEAAIDIVEKTHGQFHVLVIVADGQRESCSDFRPHPDLGAACGIHLLKRQRRTEALVETGKAPSGTPNYSTAVGGCLWVWLHASWWLATRKAPLGSLDYFAEVTTNGNNEDGKLSPQEEKTIKAIADASSYPLSIVLVGVGDGPWEDMKKFDDKLPARDFDNFQFVNFTDIMSKKISTSAKEAAFALAALMEIPFQYKAVLELGLLGHATGRAKKMVPRPPPAPYSRPMPPDHFLRNMSTITSSIDDEQNQMVHTIGT